MLNCSTLITLVQTLATVPDITDLQEMHWQAMRQRGKIVRVQWRAPGVLQTELFTLEAIWHLSDAEPQWRLHRTRAQRRETLFEFATASAAIICDRINSLFQSTGSHMSEVSNASNVSNVIILPGPTATSENNFQRQTNIAQPSEVRQIEPPMPRLGDLDNFTVAKLLQLAKFNKVTGRLDVCSKSNNVVIYIRDGNTVDACAGDAVGDDVVTELLTMRSGQFTFETSPFDRKQTVHQTLETLLTRAQKLSEHTVYVVKAGVKKSSFLLRKYENLSELEFVQGLSASKPSQIADLRNFYQHLDGRQTVAKVESVLKLSRYQLMTAIYHLLVNNMVTISDTAILDNADARVNAINLGAGENAIADANAGVHATPASVAMPANNSAPAPRVIKPKQIDVGAMQSMMMHFKRPDSGIFLYPVFLYFLEQEFFRSYRAKSQFSVIVFEMRCLLKIGDEVARQVLPPSALVDAASRLHKLKRHQDLLAHYDVFEYAFLLPCTNSSGAKVFANRLVKCLTSSPLAGMETQQLSLSVGTASIPEDFNNLSSLLGAAEACMQTAREERRSVVSYQELHLNLHNCKPA